MNSNVEANPFRRIFHLSIGDFIAKTLNFLTFIYLARILGVSSYGVLEFALSASMYVLFLADFGMEGWATREASKTSEIRLLAGRILPLRFLLSTISILLLLAILSFFPPHPHLRLLLLLFGCSSFLQAANLKWSFLGQQRMSVAGSGLVLMQVVFGTMVLILVRSDEDVLWVPVWRLAGELVMVIYFLHRFIRDHGGLPQQLRLAEAIEIWRPASVIGLSSFLALMAFNFDSVLLGFLIGPDAVAWYNAAYKPVTMALAMPVTFFIGIFPVLSREFVQDRDAFASTMIRGFHLTAVFAVPFVVGGAFLAKNIIEFLFGPAYANSIPVLQILVWSAALVILRGTFRQGLIAAHHQGLDLRCALIATVCNIVLNFLLIPRFQAIGAAISTLCSEILWFSLAVYKFHRNVQKFPLVQQLWKPVVAGFGMVAFLFFAQQLFWILRGAIAVAIYAALLLLLRGAKPSDYS